MREGGREGEWMVRWRERVEGEKERVRGGRVRGR